MIEREETDVFFNLTGLTEMREAEEKMIMIDDLIRESEVLGPEGFDDSFLRLEGESSKWMYVSQIQSLLSDIKESVREELELDPGLDVSVLITSLTKKAFRDARDEWDNEISERIISMSNEIHARMKENDIRIHGTYDAEMLARSLEYNIQSKVTRETVEGEDELWNDFRKRIQESGITDDLRFGTGYVPNTYRGTSFEEMMTQFDPISGEFIFSAPYTDTGKLIRERISEGKSVDTTDIADVMAKELEEGGILGPSTSTNLHPAAGFSNMGGRYSLIKYKNPRIVIYFNRDALEKAEHLHLSKMTEKIRFKHHKLSRRVYNVPDEVRYDPVKGEYKGNPMYELERELKMSKDELEEIIDTTFQSEKDKDDFRKDLELLRNDIRVFTPDNPASEATITYIDRRQEFHEEEVTTVLPLRVRPDQMIVMVVPQKLDTPMTMVEYQAKMVEDTLKKLSPFFRDVAIIRTSKREGIMYGTENFEIISSTMGEFGIDELGNRMTDYEIREQQLLERHNYIPKFVHPEVITSMAANITKSVIIDMGVVDIRERDKIVRLVYKLANRYIKDYIVQLFGTTL